jgi:hypothetical protein
MKITTDLSSVQIWDDLLDDRFLLDLDEESNYWNWHLNNIANPKSFPYGGKGSHLLWGTTLFDANSSQSWGKIENCPKNIFNLYQYLLNSVLKEKYKLEMISVNGQSIGQNGTTHVDNGFNEGGRTLMVFINFKWQKEWGGEFQLLEKYSNSAKIVKNIEYVPGRVILFDGNIPHRGLAPTEPYIIRKSLVYRIKKV